ncbi:MmgE/PrpD family protein [Streptococcus parauberis]|uniref:2-methylcitrate dehydratase n=1 Tax=Streptococcus parauberis KRS-02083 TaxID=1207545 RepID=A0ABP2SXK5_9STRE|nr:MmgE/PrpD family protein [Streptococcus parauberis]AEF24550.1 2-methylcitrate dehydratase [Streptococcus parauberis KCTC 11537]AUT05028.1 2-methylcitrate dehydratase [Streptococcus parauberis]EMG25120.1 2-methylcitrate dehydratase [Streptococcus parauberis KRS-02083]KYP17972.1 2-methylcitrate dehydratase [Streptococcus parauberis]KYP19158.1 2-methylcitrate dehydratase [Streptococcus parauberis]
MENLTVVEQMGLWVAGKSFEDLSKEEIEALKGRVLDAVGCAIGALDSTTIKSIQTMTHDLTNDGSVTMIGGGKTTPDNAALFNGAAIRYLDYNDSYLAKGETCHPSDNISAVLAATEHNKGNGKDFLLGLAIAYQIQCRLSDEAPVRKYGFDHTVQEAYGAAAGAAKALGLDAKQIANAIAISGTSYNSLRVTRTGELSNWKGLAAPNTARGAMSSALLAKYDITGPREVFEGNKGFYETIAGKFDIDWEREGLDRVLGTIIKRYNAEIHSQSSIEGLIEFKNEKNIPAEDIKEIRLDTFDVAFHIIGGGEEGDKKQIRLKEEADHSLPYMLSAAYLDGQVLPAQYEQDRILKDDIQNLLQKVTVKENPEFSQRFPKEMAIKLEIETYDGQVYVVNKDDYQGFTSRPASWDVLLEKYNLLTTNIDAELASNIAKTIENIENIEITELTDLLAKI